MSLAQLVFIAVPIAICAVGLALFKKPLISLRAYILATVIFQTCAQVLAFYFWGQNELYNSAYAIKSVSITLSFLGIFAAGLLVSDRKGFYPRLDKVWIRGTVGFLGSFADHFQGKGALAVSAAFMLSGIAGIFFTFYVTGVVPIFIDPAVGKYFVGVGETYLKIRPVYVASQQIIAMTSFFCLLGVLLTKRMGFRGGYLALYVAGLLILALTMKRGEMVSPVYMVFCGLLFSRIFRPVYLGISTAMLAITFFISLVVDPSMTGKMTAHLRAQPVLNAEAVAAPVEVSRMVGNRFLAGVRDNARLQYGFDAGGRQYYFGKTFAASLVSMVPTSVLDFKEKYLYPRVSLRLFGLDPEASGGPATDLPNESYINFGYLGVLMLPIIPLFVFVYFDAVMKNFVLPEATVEKRLVIGSVCVYIVNSLVMGFVTSGSGAIQEFLRRSILLAAVFLAIHFASGKFSGKVSIPQE